MPDAPRSMSQVRRLAAQRGEATGPEPIREQLAEAEGARRNGLASDGRGWFRDEEDRRECFDVADALLPVVQAYADQQAAQAWNDAADEVMRQHGTASLAAKRFRTIAAALDPTGDPQ